MHNAMEVDEKLQVAQILTLFSISACLRPWEFIRL